MANRDFKVALAKEAAWVSLAAKVTFGSSGAPTLTASDSKCVSAITQIATGIYLLAFQDQYRRFMGGGVTMVSGAAASTAPDMQAISEDVVKFGVGVAVLASVVATNTLTVNGVVFTAIASGATGNQFNLGANDTDAATNLAAAINGSVSTGITTPGITAASFGTMVVVRNPVPGTTAWAAGGGTITLSPSTALGPPAILLRMSKNGTTANPASGEIGKFFFHLSNSTSL